MKKVTQEYLLEVILRLNEYVPIVAERFGSPLNGVLYLLHDADGVNDWFLRYHYAGRESEIKIGVFPRLSLEQAKDKARAALQLVSKGIDPAYEDQRSVWGNETRLSDYLRWFKKRPNRTNIAFGCLLDYVYNLLGSYPLSKLSADDFKFCIEASAEKEGKKLLLALAIFFDYLIENKKEINPELDTSKIEVLREELGLKKILGKKSYNTSLSIYVDEWYGEVLARIDEKRKAANYRTRSVFYALSLLPYLAVNPQVLLLMRWEDLDWENQVWRAKIDEEKDLFVPLSEQSIEILNSLKAVRFYNKGFVFQSSAAGCENKAIAKTSLGKALSNLGFTSKEISTVGFKAYAERYFLTPCRYSSDAVKFQLGKKVPNEAIYEIGPGAFLYERQKMMQDLADHLDELKKNAAKKDENW